MKASRYILGLALASATASALAACSDDPVDETTARAVLHELTTTIDAAIIDYHMTDRVIAIDCPLGGTEDVSGHATMTSRPLAIDVAVRIQYRSCAMRSHKVLDGTIYFNQMLAATSPMRISASYSGHVEVSGPTLADCPVDIEVVMDEQGRSISVNGRFCGRDASDMNMTVTPLWNR